jgi:hypothetical protein
MAALSKWGKRFVAEFLTRCPSTLRKGAIQVLSPTKRRLRIKRKRFSKGKRDEESDVVLLRNTIRAAEIIIDDLSTISNKKQRTYYRSRNRERKSTPDKAIQDALERATDKAALIVR